MERAVATRAVAHGEPGAGLRIDLSQAQAQILRGLLAQRVLAHGVGNVPEREADLLHTLDTLLDSPE